MFWIPWDMPSHLYERYQWHPGRSGLYESNYLKANSPDGERALWLKHNILAWKDRTRPPVVELWCVYFERGVPPRVLKQELLVESVKLGEKEVRMEGEGIFFSPTRTTTRLVDRGQEASWDIELRLDPEGQQPVIHFPYAGMYEWGFPKKKIITPAPRMRWNGVLEFLGERIEIEDWIGFRNHNWGTEHAHQYAYGNCNHFPDAPGVLFDGFSAKIRVGPLKSPFLSAAIVRDSERDYPLNSISSILFAKTKMQFPRWQVEWQNQTHKLRVIQEGKPKEFVGLPYHHPDGKLSYCYNTKWAKTTVLLEDCSGEVALHRSDFGELEFLQATPIEGIPLYELAGEVS